MSTEPIDVVDVGTDAAPRSQYAQSTGSDRLPEPPPAGAFLDRWRWWAGADTPSRALAVLSAAAAVLAVAATADAVVSRPGVRTQIRIVDVGPGVPAAAATVDATGCPGRRRCLVAPASDTSVNAVRGRLPGGRVLAAVDTVDTGGRVYARRIVVSRRSVTLRLLAQCVPGANIDAAPSTESVTREIDTATLPNGEAKLLDDRTVTHRAVTVVGPADCSVSVLYTDSDSGSVTRGGHRGIGDATLRRLCADPRVALT